MREYSRIIRVNFSAVVGLIGLVSLIGCGGSYLNTRPVLDQQTLLQPDQGIVVARVINTSAYPLPFNNLTITPENLNESKKVKPDELQALTPYQRDTTVFASAIPPGTYALSSIYAWHFRGEYRYSKFATTDAKLGTFEVKPGHVTDLGTILYYPKPQTDKYLNVLTRVPATATGEVLTKYFPFYQYHPDKLLTWKDDGRDEERESLFASIAQNPVDFNKRYQAPDNSLYFLAKLGVIVKRTANGDWELDGVDTNLNLNAIAQNENGDLIVGGAEGKLFWKPHGKAWVDISLDNKKVIKELLFYNETTIDMIVDEGLKAVVYRAPIAGDHFAWQEMNRYDSKKGWAKFEREEPTNASKKKTKAAYQTKTKPKRISQLGIRALDNKHFIDISVQHVSNNAAFPNYDLKTYGFHPDTWVMFKPQEESEMTAIIDAGAAKLGIEEAGFWDWDGRPEYYRHDQDSDQWVEIKNSVWRCEDGSITTRKVCDGNKKSPKAKLTSFNFRSLPFFKGPLEAIVIAGFSDFDFWSGERSNEVKILATSDGGKTWTDTGNKLPFDFCGIIIREIKDRILLSCDGVSSDFYESFDDGATWEHVRQQENF